MATVRTAASDRDERSLAAVSALLIERGVGRHAIFWDVGEGEIFPDGTESMSGNVIDSDGRVYFFWTDWDAARGGPTFGTWRPVAPADDWSRSGEYRAARAAVGLDANRHGPEVGSTTKRVSREDAPRL